MMVSIATAMIPFLENDDANRALMGANMQRQAVPLMVTQAPIVATGIEHKLCVDSGVVVLAEGDGVVLSVSADNVKVRYDSGEIKDYKLIKFALQPGHVHQPAPDRRRRRPPVSGRRHCRRSGHLAGRDRARQEPAGRLHDLGRLQLRGRRSHQREAGQGGRLHLHSY